MPERQLYASHRSRDACVCRHSEVVRKQGVVSQLLAFCLYGIIIALICYNAWSTCLVNIRHIIIVSNICSCPISYFLRNIDTLKEMSSVAIPFCIISNTRISVFEGIDGKFCFIVYSILVTLRTHRLFIITERVCSFQFQNSHVFILPVSLTNISIRNIQSLLERRYEPWLLLCCWGGGVFSACSIRDIYVHIVYRSTSNTYNIIEIPHLWRICWHHVPTSSQEHAKRYYVQCFLHFL